MGAPKTAVVIGGGIVGLSVAFALQSRGVATLLVDEPRERPPASWGNAGHIAIEQSEPLGSWRNVLAMPRRLMAFGGPVALPLSEIGAWGPFGLRLMRAASPKIFERGKRALSALLGEALPAWRRLAAEVGAPELLKESGHIVAWESVGAATRGRSAWQGHRSEHFHLRDLTGEEARTLGGSLRRPLADAIRFEGTASVADPGLWLEALSAAAKSAGVFIERKRATLLEALKRADIVVVAAGARSGRLMREIGQRAPLIAERGYHIQSRSGRWPSELPPVVFEERALVVTGFASGLRATSFVEFADVDADPNPKAWARLRGHARELGLPFDEASSEWFGARPTLPDYLPAIGRSTRDPRVLYAFGHQHLGLTLGPLTAEMIGALALGEPAPLDATPFAIERF